MAERRGVPLAGIFGAARPIVGMVHLLPLPGAPGWGGSMDDVLARAQMDARALAGGGVDGILVENYNDAPFHPREVPPETVAALAVAVAEVIREVPLPVGVNVLRNDAAAALAVAAATGARFIRVNVHTGAMLADQGWLEGRAHETLRLRARLGAPVAILADVLVKHAVPPAGLELGQAARDTWHRGLVDGLIVSGEATGSPTDPERARRVRAAVPDAPVWIGSGLTPESASTLLAVADGAIVGSALERDGIAGNPVEEERVQRLMGVVRQVRTSLAAAAEPA
ncbi:MAG TPA: BtpA/SgcQ family protein [Longimicrobiales bacterium]|nr:BtpA/SgcQ family protein [Longimicrobiales bacterium]